MAFENLFIRIKRSLGGIQLDGIVEEAHQNTIRVTQNPVETGVDITDHAIVMPKKLNITAMVTDTPLGTAAFAQIIDTITGLFGTSTSANITRSQQAYNALVALQEAREPISITTRLVTYNDMLITDVSVSQDKDTSRSIVLNISTEQVIITESSIVSIIKDDLPAGTDKQASTPINSGRKEPVNVPDNTNESILKTIGGFL